MNIFDLQRATCAARARCDDGRIGTQVRNGRFDVVRVVYDAAGCSTITVVRPQLTAAQAIDVLDCMAPETPDA